VQREPFPHMVIEGMWDPGLLRAVASEYPPPTDGLWKRYDNRRERKLEGAAAMWGPNTYELADMLASDETCEKFADAFGTPSLHCEFTGGGMHMIPPGGYLAVHADFNRSPRTRRYRRLNCLVFLNEDWPGGGDLELWDDNGPAVRIVPEFNVTVVFETSATSFHGHPAPLPGDRCRKSFAAYYFQDEPTPGYVGEASTVFHACSR